MTMQPDRRWEAFATREPFFAVFTDPRFRSANRTLENEREFFESGELLVDSLLRIIKRKVASDFTPDSILEFGCGPGRLAIPFARYADSVTAVDRSQAMLDAARREAAKRAVVNIDFKPAGEFFARARKFHLVNCYHVFQRLPPAEGLALFRTLLGSIGSGGVGAFQFLFSSSTPCSSRGRAGYAKRCGPSTASPTSFAAKRSTNHSSPATRTTWTMCFTSSALPASTPVTSSSNGTKS